MTEEKTMTKSKLIDHIAGGVELSKREAEDVLDCLFTTMETQLGSKGPGEFTIPGVVKLKVAEKAATKARTGRNPATGKPITIPARPAHKVIKASLLKAVRDLDL